MIREPNKLKRLDWCIKPLEDNDDYPKLKPTDPGAKHPVKVYVWAGISKRGATQVCIFEGKVDAEFYLRILWHYLLPFIASDFPSKRRFMQDNDAKHTSREFYCQLVAHTS